LQHFRHLFCGKDLRRKRFFVCEKLLYFELVAGERISLFVELIFDDYVLDRWRAHVEVGCLLLALLALFTLFLIAELPSSNLMGSYRVRGVAIIGDGRLGTLDFSPRQTADQT
jgi:hypothetical protein